MGNREFQEGKKVFPLPAFISRQWCPVIDEGR